MSGEACTLPSRGGEEHEIIGRMLSSKRIAIVGMSDDPGRPSHRIGAYLLSNGFEIIPVNPKHENVLGKKCYPSLRDVPEKIDLVNVFRRPLACAAVAEDAISIGAKGLWLQSGIRNEDAKKIAEQAGMDFIQDRCIMVEHMSR
jgi:predicted CoA-binding protein